MKRLIQADFDILSPGTSFRLLALLGWLLYQPTPLQADPPLTAFDACMNYVQSTQELDRKFRSQKQAEQDLMVNYQKTMQSIAETRVTIEQLLSEQALQSARIVSGQLEGAAIEAELKRQWEKPVESTITHTGDPWDNPIPRLSNDVRQTLRSDPKAARVKQMADGLLALRTQVDMQIHYLKTVNVSGNLAVQRYMALMEEVAGQLNEARNLQVKPLQLFVQYWDLADVLSVKSELLHLAALRELEKAAKENLGAKFARAITLMRLDRHDQAEPLINELVQIPAIRAYALVARAELHARLNRQREAASDMNQALALAAGDPRVRMHRGQVYAFLGNWKEAEREWELVLKAGGHEIAAHRALAIINASLAAPNQRQLTKGNQYAAVAVQLAADDWSCEAAAALAAAASGDTSRAVQAAQRAGQLAIGSQKIFCNLMCEQIETGQAVAWRF